MSKENIEISRMRKPIGVYVLTIGIFLRFGVIQFTSDFNAVQDSGRAIPFLIAVILLGSNVFTAGASVIAFFGEELGRIILLALISVNVLWTVFTAITYVSFNEYEKNSAGIIFDLSNSVFWLVISWWYLNKKNVVGYYKRND